MTDEEIYRLVGVEPTPQIKELVWLVRQQQLVGFWEAATKQAKYQVEAFEAGKTLLEENNT